MSILGYNRNMEIVLWSLIFVVSLVAMVKSADYFTEYASKLGLALGLSSFIIGATIVAIGTSLPELISSLFAVAGGATEFVADNIIGSNIANALLVLGVAAIFAKTLKVSTSLIDVDLPFFFMSMGLFIFFSLDKRITWPEGVFLMVLFVIFVLYSAKAGSKEPDKDKDELRELKQQYKRKKKKPPYAKFILYILISGAILATSAKFMIDSLLTISDILNVSSSLLTITIVALGTSLPEVFASVSAIKLGNHGMVIGNVFGSNTFNLLLVGGLPTFFSELPINEITFMVGIPFLLLATFAAIFSTMDNTVRFWEGASLLFLYFVFLAKIVHII